MYSPRGSLRRRSFLLTRLVADEEDSANFATILYVLRQVEARHREAAREWLGEHLARWPSSQRVFSVREDDPIYRDLPGGLAIDSDEVPSALDGWELDGLESIQISSKRREWIDVLASRG